MAKRIQEIARIIVGLVFIFSAVVKGIDPLGTVYKLTDYFYAFHTSWANSAATILAFALIGAEFIIGFSLLFKFKTQIFSWLLAIFMGVFLPLTLYIAIKNPVTDCGCFGDAIKISNWSTFYKNIVLSILTIIILINRKNFRIKYNELLQTRLWLSIVIAFVIFVNYSYTHLPLIDFRPYKIGVNILDGMTIPDNAPMAEYEYTFVYKNKQTGKEKTFNDQNYPWNDTINWEYVSADSKLIKEGYEAPIHDFTIENNYGENVADYYLTAPGYTFLLVAYDLNKTATSAFEQINELALKINDAGHSFICLSGSTEDQIEDFSINNNTKFEYYFCDDVTLKTMIRSNPGLVVLHEGTIVKKLHWRDLPKAKNWEKLINN